MNLFVLQTELSEDGMRCTKGSLAMYHGDYYAYCESRKCKKKTKWVRCPRCNGKGGGSFSQCSNKCNSGYKCENGKTDPWH